jgi:hypothetical protein
LENGNLVGFWTCLLWALGARPMSLTFLKMHLWCKHPLQMPSIF